MAKLHFAQRKRALCLLVDETVTPLPVPEASPPLLTDLFRWFTCGGRQRAKGSRNQDWGCLEADKCQLSIQPVPAWAWLRLTRTVVP